MDRKIVKRNLVLLYETTKNGDDIEAVCRAIKGVADQFDRRSPEKSFVGNLTRLLDELVEEVRGEAHPLTSDTNYLVMRE